MSESATAKDLLPHIFCRLLAMNLSSLYNLGMTPNSTQSGTPIEIEKSGRQNRGCPPPTPEESQRRWAAWHQAMEFSHEMLMMGLRQRIGPDGDLQAAYRDWYERYQDLKWDTHRAS